MRPPQGPFALLCIATTALAACTETPPSQVLDAGMPSLDAGSLADSGPAPDAAPTYADGDWMFDSTRLLRIEIEVPEDSWDALRQQSRNIIKLLGDACAEGPSYSPFTYVRANVSIDGQRVEDVGIRKKGFLGSLSESKPSLKVKFNEYVPGQRFSGWKRMTLNNSVQDPSYMNQCLGYRLFEAAGVPAPRCSFATVRVNGRNLGVYVHVESIKKPFLGRYFDDTSGNMYEGTLSDFRPDWVATYERKTNESDPLGSEDRSDLLAIVGALTLEDDAVLLTALGGLIDLDSFYSFWVVESMLAHWDGYAGNNNNHYIYADPATGKFTFIPWGADQLFGDGPDWLDFVMTRGIITRRLFLHAPSRQAYMQRYETILNNAWDEAAMRGEVDRLQAMLAPEIAAEEQPSFDEAVQALRRAIAGRTQRMTQALQNAGPQDADELAEPLCFEQSGTLSASFESNYQQAPTSVDLQIILQGQPEALSGVSAGLGPNEEQDDTSVLYLVGYTPNGRQAVAVVSVPNSLVGPGTVDLTERGIEAYVVYIPPGSEEPDAVYYMDGEITFEQANPVAGAAWKGSVSAKLWAPPWL